MNKKYILLAATLICIWGICWPIYKEGLQYAPPFLYLSLRLTIGGLLLIIVLYKKRVKLQLKENFKFYTISALLNVVLTMGLQTLGMVHLPSGIISILVYVQPIFVSILAWQVFGDTLSKVKIISLCLGFCGIVMISIDSFFLNLSMSAVVISIASAIFWAVGVIYVKKVSFKVDSFWMVAMQSFIGGVILFIWSAFTEDWSLIDPQPMLFIAVGWGATFGIPLAFIIFYYLNDHMDISKVSAYTFLVPILAVILGVIFRNEPFNVNILIGLVLVSFSIYCINNEKQMGLLFTKGKGIKDEHSI